MRIVAAIVPICISLAGIAHATPGRDDQRARTYAFAFAGAAEAQEHCPGMEMDRAGLSALREAAHLGSDKDDRAFLRARFDEFKPDMERQIANGAEAWCTKAYGIFGPKGLHSLRRQ